MGTPGRIVTTALVVLTLGTGLASCGSDDGGASAKPATTGTSHPGRTGTEITIENFAFEPKPLRAKSGATITVTNADDTTHTVTADDGAFDTGDIGATGTVTFTVGGPGRYRFHCDIHNYMTGSVIVS